MVWASSEQCLRDYDALVLTETHWKSPQEFETPGWYAISTGAPSDKSAGILILVRRTLCASSLLQSNIVVPGRVIHVRVPVAASGDKAVDLVGVYQHAWNCQIPQAEMLAKREKILLRFSQTISNLPHRNQLVVAGDFNVSAFPLQRHIGPQVRLSLNPLPDCEFFCSMIQGLNLVILNSWTKAASVGTFCTAGTLSTCTHIDFILTRLGTADTLAKTSSTARQPRLFAWRGGGFHWPVSASIPLLRYLATGGPASQKGFDLQGLRAAVQAHSGSCATTSERGHGNSAGISPRLSGGSQQFVVPPHEEVLSAGTSDSAAPAVAACRHADWDQTHVAGTQTCKVLCTWNDPEARWTMSPICNSSLEAYC